MKPIPLKGGGRQGVPWGGQEGHETERQAAQDDCGPGDLRGEMSFGGYVDRQPSWAIGSLAVYRTSVGGFFARPGHDPFATTRTSDHQDISLNPVSLGGPSRTTILSSCSPTL